MENETLRMVFWGVVLLLVYFLPTIVAGIREAKNGYGIVMLNLWLGWTVLGWFVAFVLACAAPSEENKSAGNNAANKIVPKPDRIGQLERLLSLKEKGQISEEEFQSERKKIFADDNKAAA